MEATRTFEATQFARALRDWAWIGLEGKTPLFTSPFGDVFFQADDGIWRLDMLEGDLARLWANTAQMDAALATEDGQDDYLYAGLAWGAHLRGVIPNADEIYIFSILPIIGGPITVDNISVINFVAGLSIMGATHGHIQNWTPAGRRPAS